MADSRQAMLFSPGQIGPIGLKNRIIMAPMTTRKADADGFVTDAGIAYYVRRAAGGVGLITVEMASPERVGKHRNFELGLYDDRFLPGLTRLAAAIHAAGAKASIQLGHGGGHTRIDIAGETPIAPSALPHSVQEGHTETIVPEAMTTERIARTRQAFADAATRAARAGFDAVEIHAAHGYLISQFLAPAENVRDDDYGGSLANRARFALEVTRAVKAAVPHLAVVFRMNGDDFFDGGLRPEEAVAVAQWAAEAGADAIHMTGGHYRSKPTAAIMIPPMATEPTPFLKYAAAIKARVAVPVISVGRFGDPDAAAAAIAGGDCDFVALGRPLLADPDWVRKAEGGHEVRRCLACNTCVDGMRTGSQLHCLVNPATGRELTFSAAPTRQGQRIAIIGAGPAGLTCASLLAEGNRVTVFDRTRHTGGAYLLAGHAPLFQGVAASPASLEAFVAALERDCRSRGVTFALGSDPVADIRLLDGFDHVVVATGARYRGGIGGLVAAALRARLVSSPPLAAMARNERVRDWFYHVARSATGAEIAARIGGRGFTVEVIGDASRAGKSEAAFVDAYRVAFGIFGEMRGGERTRSSLRGAQKHPSAEGTS